MKRRSLLSIILGAILLFSSLGALGCGSGSENGGDNTGGGVTANNDYVLSGDHYVLSTYTGSEEVLTIKSEINGIPVTQIAEDALEENQTVTKVIIPDSITKMGEYAFYKCTSLVEVQMGNGITQIATSAFDGCSKLKTVKFPSGLISIGKRAFYNCPIEEINLPNSVKTINEKAFYQNRDVKTFTFPNSLTTLGNESFKNCMSLETINVNTELEEIKSSTFENCQSLKNVNFAMDGKLKRINSAAFLGAKSIEQLKFPDSLKVIEFAAFYNCKGLRKVEFGKKIEYIGGNVSSTHGGAFGEFVAEEDTDNVHILEMIFPEEAIGFGWYPTLRPYNDILIRSYGKADGSQDDLYFITPEEIRNNEARQQLCQNMTGYSWTKCTTPNPDRAK